MLVADTSVWVSYLNQHKTGEALLLANLLASEEPQVLVPDVVVMEVLMGPRDDVRARRAQRALGDCKVVEVGGFEAALRAARRYRQLRALSITVRSTVDALIASYCIDHDVELLHLDRDFDHYERHVGLRVRRP